MAKCTKQIYITLEPHVNLVTFACGSLSVAGLALGMAARAQQQDWRVKGHTILMNRGPPV